MYLLENNQHLSDAYATMFDLFRNIIMQKYFQYLNDNLLILLTRYILNFSFQMTNSFQQNIIVSSNESSNIQPQYFRHLTLQNQIEIKSCVELIDQLVDNLTMISCINHIVLCLCELLDLTWQFQLINKADGFKLSRSDYAKYDINDEIIKHIYQVDKYCYLFLKKCLIPE